MKSVLRVAVVGGLLVAGGMAWGQAQTPGSAVIQADAPTAAGTQDAAAHPSGPSDVKVVRSDGKRPSKEELAKMSAIDPKLDSPPEAIYSVDPKYTDKARARREQGSVLISVTVDEKGHPRGVHVVRGIDHDYGLNDSAVAAVKQYRFRPAVKDGKAVSKQITVEVTFDLY